MVKFCKRMLETGGCTDTTCARRHDIFVCLDCGVTTLGEQAQKTHVNSNEHRRRVDGALKFVRCPCCQVICPGGHAAWTLHRQSHKHNNAARAQGVSADVVPADVVGDVPGYVLCDVCDAYVQQTQWERHPLTKAHQKKARFGGGVRSVMAEAAKDKLGITVSGDDLIDFGTLVIAQGQCWKEVNLDICCTSPISSISILPPSLSSQRSEHQASPFAFQIVAIRAQLTRGQTAAVVLTFAHEHLGVYSDRIELAFEDTTVGRKFLIARQMRATVAAPGYDELLPKVPFVPRKRSPRDHEAIVVSGDPPPAYTKVNYVVRLPTAPVMDQFRSSMMPATFKASTYGGHFKALVWAEEYQAELDIQDYDIENTNLTKRNNLYYLHVPGLAENRPSVLVGDGIFVQPVAPGMDRSKWYQGRVYIVAQLEVGMKFGSRFPAAPPTQPYRVRFTLNRIPYCRQHQALNTSFPLDRLLFPTDDHILPPNVDAPFSIRNRLIENNPPQVQAVTGVLGMPPGSPVFVLFGPPGTGKTVTIVEAILQLLSHAKKEARILACAPSNSAADIIAERLSSALGETELYRFYAPSRFASQVPDVLRRYTTSDPSGSFTLPPIAQLNAFRVIVSTCVSASFAHNIGMERGHFTHIFVDEAAQATEPEVMTAIKTMADARTNVVLSGDPKQLGPVIRSAVARRFGLDKSYLERVMERAGCTVVQLTQNFRSHPAILKFPSEQFYENTLQPCGDPAIIDSYVDSPILPNPKFPVIFHALAGEDAREASSPSYFNPLQVLQVKSYVEQLRSDHRFQIRDQDIAIIAPYRAQVLKIRASLRGIADDVKVGSVEELQGQERRVIILSTVRSSRELVDYDLRHTLGFLENPRRMNVAITRAQALLIVIGDPDVLSLDPRWRKFMNYVFNEHGWRGDAPAWDTHEPVDDGREYDVEIREAAAADVNDLRQRMLGLEGEGLSGEDGSGDDSDSEQSADVDRPWRAEVE
ncbi:DEXXQ/H-box helicase domain-containing protein [Phanerochaete sordida]|uniref:RNA helicase n=1 Tax=Phanerochaete sordida TaxID=48140 RepID=A0A9P3LDP4_9APHY|nr:DEXXQ/H-box helicase domain-containing protein [Phanerochaete sordida]